MNDITVVKCGEVQKRMKKWDDDDSDLMIDDEWVSVNTGCTCISTCSSKYAAIDTGVLYAMHAYWKMSFKVVPSCVW